MNVVENHQTIKKIRNRRKHKQSMGEKHAKRILVGPLLEKAAASGEDQAIAVKYLCAFPTTRERIVQI